MDWTSITEVSTHLASGLPLFGAAVLVLIAARFLFLRSTPFRVGQDLIDAENPAVAVVFAAYMFSVGLALIGTLFGRAQDGTLIAVTKIFIEGITAIVLLRISIWVNDRFILHRFSVVQELRADQNVGVGFCVAGSVVASGLILNGAITGFSDNFGYGMRDIVIYWLLGQVVFLFGAWVYHRMARYDVHELIEYDDNVAVGIGFGAFLLSLGIVVRASLVHAGLEPLTKELPRALLLALVGTLGVLAATTLATRLITASLHYEDEVEMHGNVAVSTVTAGVTFAIALLLAAIIQR